jgi:hypothetical protein
MPDVVANAESLESLAMLWRDIVYSEKSLVSGLSFQKGSAGYQTFDHTHFPVVIWILDICREIL